MVELGFAMFLYPLQCFGKSRRTRDVMLTPYLSRWDWAILASGHHSQWMRSRPPMLITSKSSMKLVPNCAQESSLVILNSRERKSIANLERMAEASHPIRIYTTRIRQQEVINQKLANYHFRFRSAE